jgi:hypothetical protein
VLFAPIDRGWCVTLKKILHLVRRVDVWLLPPAIAFVAYGELSQGRLVELLTFNIWDKVLHFTAYLGLCVMATVAVRADRRALWWALGLVAMGGMLEIIQGLTGRDADIFDELANTLGVLTGLGIGWFGVGFLRARNLVDDGAAE